MWGRSEGDAGGRVKVDVHVELMECMECCSSQLTHVTMNVLISKSAKGSMLVRATRTPLLVSTGSSLVSGQYGSHFLCNKLVYTGNSTPISLV